MTWDQELPLCLSFSIHTWGLFCLTSGSRLTLQDLASFQPEVVDALEMPLGDYTLYSPPPPAAGAILSLVLNVLKGETPPRRPPPPSHPESCPTGISEPSWSFGQPSSSGSAPPQTPNGNGSGRYALCPRAGLRRSPHSGALLKG